MLSRHPWAIGLLEARPCKGPPALRYLDAILGTLRAAGFSIENAVHAFWLLDSFVYGHVIQEIDCANQRVGGVEEYEQDPLSRRSPPANTRTSSRSEKRP